MFSWYFLVISYHFLFISLVIFPSISLLLPYSVLAFPCYFPCHSSLVPCMSLLFCYYFPVISLVLPYPFLLFPYYFFLTSLVLSQYFLRISLFLYFFPNISLFFPYQFSYHFPIIAQSTAPNLLNFPYIFLSSLKISCHTHAPGRKRRHI